MRALLSAASGQFALLEWTHIRYIAHGHHSDRIDSDESSRPSSYLGITPTYYVGGTRSLMSYGNPEY